jgi:hypothetical protein
MAELFKDEVFESIIDVMPENFDSHDFIFEMMRHYPREYTNALYQYRRSKDPINTLHSMIGRKLLSFETKIKKSKKKTSKNPRGLPSTNQYWRKIEKKRLNKH